MKRVRVIDLFAGPGGLGEGFSAFSKGSIRFDIALSIEMEKHAHSTLTLRALYRRLAEAGALQPYYDYVRGYETKQNFLNQSAVRPHFADAANEARQHVLSTETRGETARLIRTALGNSTDDWILIGGPPCQAYSLVGRARNTNVSDFEQDHRHFLYREYLEVLNKFSPPVFIMENVKGLLSSSVAGRSMFGAILRDLSSAGEAGYHVQSVAVGGNELSARDYVVRSELYGLPQARHRVILVGIRKDFQNPSIRQLEPVSAIPAVKDAIADLPKLRSRLSRGDSAEDWRQRFRRVRRLLLRRGPAHCSRNDQILETVEEALAALRQEGIPGTGERFTEHPLRMPDSDLMHFLHDSELGGVLQHETRSHMAGDIERYIFASAYADVTGTSPRVHEFPRALWPKHANINRKDVPFTDRFRVQLQDFPARTVVAHISKDGHAFIHFDPAQARSLTVREAARLQTFPDNYFFEGPRTAQYVQVGNAVPPFLSIKIAERVAQLFEAQDSQVAS